MKVEEIQNKWNKTGLLDGLSLESKKELSQLFEELSSYLFYRSKKQSDGYGFSQNSDVLFFNVTLIPILRRIYDALPSNKKMPSISWLIVDYEEFLKKINKDSYSEEEICEYYTRDVIKRL